MAEIAINEDNLVTRGGYLIGKERLVLSMLQKKNEARKKHARQLIAFWACLLLLGIRGKETRIALDRYLFEPSRAIHGHLSWGEDLNCAVGFTLSLSLGLGFILVGLQPTLMFSSCKPAKSGEWE